MKKVLINLNQANLTTQQLSINELLTIKGGDSVDSKSKCNENPTTRAGVVDNVTGPIGDDPLIWQAKKNVVIP